MTPKQVSNPGAKGDPFETPTRSPRHPEGTNAPKTNLSCFNTPSKDVDRSILNVSQTISLSKSADSPDKAFSKKEKRKLLDEGFTFVTPKGSSKSNSPLISKNLKRANITSTFNVSPSKTTTPTSTTSISHPKDSNKSKSKALIFNSQDNLSMAEILRKKTITSNIQNRTSSPQKRPNTPTTVKEHFQELNTFQINSEFGTTFKAVFEPGSSFRSDTDLKPFTIAVSQKLKEDPKFNDFQTFLDCLVIEVKTLSFYHQKGEKLIKTASLSTPTPSRFEQQDDIKERFYAIMKSTAHDFGFTLLTNEKVDKRHLATLCITFPKSTSPEDFSAVSADFLQPYGDVVFQYTKRPPAVFTHDISLSHYVILDARNQCLPPITKNFFSKELKKVVTIKTHVVFCSDNSFCHYCKSLTHKTNKCPFKKGCFHCHSQEHTYLQCQTANSFEKMTVFQNNPEPVKNTFFEFPRFKTGIPALLLEQGISYLNKKAHEDNNSDADFLLSPKKHKNDMNQSTDQRKYAKRRAPLPPFAPISPHKPMEVSYTNFASTPPPINSTKILSMYDTEDNIDTVPDNITDTVPDNTTGTVPDNITETVPDSITDLPSSLKSKGNSTGLIPQNETSPHQTTSHEGPSSLAKMVQQDGNDHHGVTEDTNHIVQNPNDSEDTTMDETSETNSPIQRQPDDTTGIF